jgi:hypothetical protein
VCGLSVRNKLLSPGEYRKRFRIADRQHMACCYCMQGFLPAGRDEEVHLTMTRVFRPRSHPEIATLPRFVRSIDMQAREL